MPATIHRIEVINAKPHRVLVTEKHANLPEDKNWRQDYKALAGDASLYRQGQSPYHERPFAFSPPEIEIDHASNIGYMTSYTSETIVSSGSAAVFKLKSLTGFLVPLGFWGYYSIDIHRKDGTAFALGTVPLEFYYLSAHTLPNYFKEGIPLLLLRMFVLSLNRRITNVEGWVETVTKIAFGSMQPFNGLVLNTKDHWLSYNSIDGGAPSFSSAYGLLGLNLDAWLDSYRNFKRHDVITRVNCYDQAAITEVVLCLGIPHEQIHWEYHQRYGFIDAELVGWGRVNNPYFDGEKTFANLPKRDPTRQPFRNHAYLSWSKEPVSETLYKAHKELMETVKTRQDYVSAARQFEESKGLRLFMIDACGGPHVGRETREEYESEKNIEQIGDPDVSFSDAVRKSYNEKGGKEAWAEEHHLGPGITDWYHYLPKGKMQEFEKAVNILINLTTTPGSGTVKYTPFPSLQTEFRNYINSEVARKWKRNISYAIRPYKSDNGTTVHEEKFNFSRRQDSKLDRAATIRVAHNDSKANAQRALCEHLAFKALSIGSASTKIIDRGRISASGQEVTVVGTYYTRAFMWHNVAVEITIEEDQEWVANGNTLLRKCLTALIREAAESSTNAGKGIKWHFARVEDKDRNTPWLGYWKDPDNIQWPGMEPPLIWRPRAQVGTQATVNVPLLWKEKE